MSILLPMLRRSVSFLCVLFCLLLATSPLLAQIKRTAKVPETGPRGIVIDERLAALRESPNLNAFLLQRLSRGRPVAILGLKKQSDGITFYRVAVTRNTYGWLQAEAVATAYRPNDDERTWELIQASDDYERIARARIFLDMFPRAPRRAAVLLLMGDEAEIIANRLSREASRRLAEEKMAARAPARSYFMNYNGLDRYNRQGVTFVFDEKAKRYHYDGTVWREITRRHPNSPETAEARKRLENLAAMMSETETR